MPVETSLAGSVRCGTLDGMFCIFDQQQCTVIANRVAVMKVTHNEQLLVRRFRHYARTIVTKGGSLAYVIGLFFC